MRLFLEALHLLLLLFFFGYAPQPECFQPHLVLLLLPNPPHHFHSFPVFFLFEFCNNVSKCPLILSRFVVNPDDTGECELAVEPVKRLSETALLLQVETFWRV